MESDEGPVDVLGISKDVGVEGILEQLAVDVVGLIPREIFFFVHGQDACLPEELAPVIQDWKRGGLTLHSPANRKEYTEKLDVLHLRTSHFLDVVVLEFRGAQGEVGKCFKGFAGPEGLLGLIPCPIADSFHATWVPRVLHVPEASAALPEVDQRLQNEMMGRLEEVPH